MSRAKPAAGGGEGSPAPPAEPSAEPPPLFLHEVRRDGRRIALLRGVKADGGITVEAEVQPASKGSALLRRPFVFANRQQADRFVEEALIALEYLGCAVVDGEAA